MNWLDLFGQIFEVCIIPLLGVLTAYAVKYIKMKSDELVIKSENDMVDKYIIILSDVISNCVIATNQTYVKSLKEQGKFDAEAQKVAFDMTLKNVLSILNDEATECLTEAFGDLNAYITTQIEASVNDNK